MIDFIDNYLFLRICGHFSHVLDPNLFSTVCVANNCSGTPRGSVWGTRPTELHALAPYLLIQLKVIPLVTEGADGTRLRFPTGPVTEA